MEDLQDEDPARCALRQDTEDKPTGGDESRPYDSKAKTSGQRVRGEARMPTLFVAERERSSTGEGKSLRSAEQKTLGGT